jgi:uncharacterized protein YifE (UPF0438 family)
MARLTNFTNPSENFKDGSFETAPRPKSPSPKTKDYRRRSKKKADKQSKCTYIHPDTGKRCKNLLDLYTQFCELHTMMINNVYISKSQIPNAGNGLYAGPYGFKKGDVIGKYSQPWNDVTLGTLNKRCKNDNCWNYVFCDEDDPKNVDKTKCWDGYDIRSTLMRNINDAHKSNFKNNCYFDVIKGEVYIIASKKIKPHKELFVSYGPNYF